MMKIRIFVVLVAFSMISYAQENPFRRRIDSLVQNKWDELAVDLDSLSSLKLVDLKISKKDTILVKAPAPISEAEFPVTPFAFMNTIRERKWFLFGQNSLQFNQSSYSNWSAGGNNSIGVIGRINYALSYKNGEHFWDNNIKLGYGMLSISGRELRKTEDYINISSKYGYDLGQYYYLLMGVEFSSQFSAGYNYTPSKKRKYSDRISRFMAPGYLNFGLGVLYNPKENFQISLSPINTKLTFVLDKILQKKGRYGLERDGQSVRREIGAMMNIVYRLKIYKDISWVHQLNLFSNYTQKPQNIDIAYSGLLTMKFNKFISTTLSLDLVYDHDQIKNIQMKQTLGVGISYNLGIENKEKNVKKDKVKIFLK